MTEAIRFYRKLFEWMTFDLGSLLEQLVSSLNVVSDFLLHHNDILHAVTSIYKCILVHVHLHVNICTILQFCSNQEVLEDFCTVWWYMITNSIWKNFKVVEIYALYETSIRVRELSYRIFLCEGDKGSPSISFKIRSVL